MNETFNSFHLLWCIQWIESKRFQLKTNKPVIFVDKLIVSEYVLYMFECVVLFFNVNNEIE